MPVVVSAVTVTETLRGTGRDVPVRMIVKRAQVVPVDEAVAVEAGRLLGRTDRNDTVDALVAVTAGRLAGPVVLLTSNPGDLADLTEEYPHVRVVAV